MIAAPMSSPPSLVAPVAAVRALEDQQSAMTIAYQDYGMALTGGDAQQITAPPQNYLPKIETSASLLSQLAAILPDNGSSGSWQPLIPYPLQDPDLAYATINEPV